MGDSSAINVWDTVYFDAGEPPKLVEVEVSRAEFAALLQAEHDRRMAQAQEPPNG